MVLEHWKGSLPADDVELQSIVAGALAWLLRRSLTHSDEVLPQQADSPGADAPGPLTLWEHSPGHVQPHPEVR